MSTSTQATSIDRLGTAAPVMAQCLSQVSDTDPTTLNSGMHPESAVSEFIRKLDQSKSIDEFRKVMSDTLLRFNCSHFHYHLIYSKGEINSGARLTYGISTYPSEWIELYHIRRYLDDDPMTARALMQQEAFTWTEVLATEPVSPRRQQFFEDMRAASLEHSIALPLHGRGGEKAVLHLALNTSMSLTSRGSIYDNLSVLNLIAWHYHARIYAPIVEQALNEGSRRKTLLSARERHVLGWVARGKSTLEIAIIMKISAKTIEFHIENVKLKLQVYNRTHAVAKAIMLGLLDYP